MSDKIAAVRAEVLQWRLFGALTWQAGATLLAGSAWNAVQLRTWTHGPGATIFTLRAAVVICTLAALQLAAVLALRRVGFAPPSCLNTCCWLLSVLSPSCLTSHGLRSALQHRHCDGIVWLLTSRFHQRSTVATTSRRLWMQRPAVLSAGHYNVVAHRATESGS